MLQDSNSSAAIQPKVVVIRRRPNQGFGFTLRHFIAYPPEDDPSWPQEASDPYHHQVKAMETIFIKEVQTNGPAHYANLQTGDRVLMVNNTPIAGLAYSTIVSMIKQTPSVLTLHVVPKECDVLQMHYTSIAHTPETNRLATAPRPIPSPVTVGNGNAAGALIPITPAAASASTISTSTTTKSFSHQQQQQQQQQLISYPQPLLSGSSGGAGGKASRSGSITSSGGSSFRPTSTVGSAGDFIDMPSQGLHQQHNSGGRLLIRDDGGGGAFLSRSQPPPNLTVLSRQQQHQLYHTQSAAAAAAAANSAFYAPASGVGAVDTSELMIRLRESIKQKEEFLKSPLPHTHATLHSVPAVSHTAQQHFFPPHTPPSGSPQLSMVSTTSTSAGSSVLSSIGGGGGGPRGQVRTHVKQPLSATSSSASSTRELLPANVSAIEMHQYYGSVSSTGTGAGKNHIATTSGGGGVGGNYISMESTSMSRSSATGVNVSASGVRAASVETMPMRRAAGNGSANSRANNNNGMGDKYVKDLDYLESLQETGVTNKVFERKLVSHLAKGFDPFQPLSINTNACVEPSATAATGNVVLIKKPTVLYESLQHHPLHQLQVQQLQQTTAQQAQTTHAPMQLTKLQQQQLQQHVSGSVVDGVQYSRMEIHKASLATTTIDHAPSNKYTGKLPEALGSITTTSTIVAVAEPKPALTDIAESNEVPASSGSSSQVTTTTPGTSSADGNGSVGGGTGVGAAVVRRFKPMSSFDDSKPMRRISYLRATNNETDYSASDTSITSLTGLNSSVVGIGAPPPLIEVTSKQSSLDDDDGGGVGGDDDPTYDVVAGDERATIQTTAELMAATAQEQLLEQQQQHLKDRASVTAEAAIVAAVTAAGVGGGAAAALSESRRESVNSEIRNSVHIDDVIADINGKLETKDVATEMEVFETEMEIKSSCINGKRLSDYRSWRQVKIEIKGDILRIYPGRGCKESNMIELDIRNFKIFDESVDKKKSYMFRMQSKPTQIATLGNELNLDDVPDKLTSSGSSASTTASHVEPTHHQPHQQPTEILFKTKSMTEMKRIFGLLQWKNSLIYDDSDLQGRQLAEPQKTAAISSMPTATYCDDNVQHQHQQLQPEYSPLSTTSRGGDSELITDSISPVMKTRKSSSHKNIPDKDLGSPKAKNWKDLLFRRGGGSSSHNADISPSSLASGGKTTGSIGVPLKSCPMSKNNEFVPLLVDVCTNIVETKGLGIVGIYRIPGNKAAISELSEQVNKSDFSWDRCNTDVRWEDVNVVSSLLKQYIRNLPDALLPCSFYINFIEADKKTGLERLKELRELLNSLPRHSYETLKHLIRHLSRVSKNCEVNLMEPKNLAIIFGPSIIRTPNDTLEIAVKDMKHQCRIVELLVTQYDYFFENGPLPDLADVTGNTPIASTSSSASGALHTQEDQTNMLLHNVSKIERLTERESSSTTRTSRFIPQLRRRTHSKRGAASSDTYSGESVLSLDSTKSVTTAMTTSSSSTNATTASSSSGSGGSSSVTSATQKTKKERNFLINHSGGGFVRLHHRKASLDEKDSGSCSGSGSGSGGSMSKEQQRSSVDISVLLTDDESSNSRSDTGSMSLTTITDTLDSKLRNLRSGSESNDENGSPEFRKNRRHTLGQPLHLHSENIPYADESPERHFHSCPLDAPNVLMLSRSCTATNTIATAKANESKEQRVAAVLSAYKNNKLQHSATVPINPGSTTTIVGSGSTPSTAASTPTAILTVKTTNTQGGIIGTNVGGTGSGGNLARNSYLGRGTRFTKQVYEQQCCSDDDSEGSTTSDPKDSLIIASPPFFLDRYNKKRRDHRLFRSASFNCRNYSSSSGRHSSSGGQHTTGGSASALTKDEKTDMNLTKKRQIQNKQNRSIKRRHTVGGPHDYVGPNGCPPANSNNCNHQHTCKVTAGAGGTTTTTTTVLRRIPIPSANGNISNNNNNINTNLTQDGNNGNGAGGGSGNGGGNGVGGDNAGTATVAMASGAGGEHVLEVGIRIKNINRSRY